MRLILAFFILFICIISVFPQNVSSDNLEPNLNKEDWEVLQQKVADAEKIHDYENALIFAAKAKQLSEKLNDNLLIARSWHLKGRVLSHLPKFSEESVNAYKESFNKFNSLEKTLDSRKYAGYLFNDWMLLYSDPDYNHSEEDLKLAFNYLFTIYNMIQKYPTSDKKELEILTALNISNCFYDSGHLLAQLIWLEYVQNELAKTTEKIDPNLYFLINLRLQKAYRRFGDYEKAFICLNNLDNFLKRNPNDFLRLDYLFDLQDAYSDIKNTLQMFNVIEEGLKLAEKVNYRLGEFYAMKIKRLLQEEKIPEAKEAYQNLKKMIGLYVEKIDLTVINAVIAGYEGNTKLSDDYFLEGHRILNENLNGNWSRALFLLNWEATIANFQKRYDKLENIINEYRNIASDNNQKDSMPWIYMTGAKAQIGLGNLNKAKDNLQKAINFIEDKRKIESAQQSIGVMEVLFEAYQIKIELENNQNNLAESFLASELLKSRWLQDKISNNRLSRQNNIGESIRQSIFSSALKFLEKPFELKENSQLVDLESKALFENNTVKNPNEDLNLIKSLENSDLDTETAVVSFAFTSKSLIAFVYRKGNNLKSYRLNLTLDESDQLTNDIHQKIKKLVYYRQNGKILFDLLLKPLKLDNVKNLIIIPDKSLWKMPFQALSRDGQSYLIENTRISYAPSISILLKLLSKPKLERKTFQVFSNAIFNNYLLRYADSEAKTLAQFYGVQPNLSATISEFKEKSEKSDILHFSMHAEFEEEPFKSFLAFNKDNFYPTGKLTVNDLLKLRLKSQSLVFLASCSTNNVLSSEGLVSLSWGMLGSGATTVISAQWEANDESTEQFTKRFYKYYKTGISASDAIQKASIEMINLPNEKLGKPFYWAEFTLNGDFR